MLSAHGMNAATGPTATHNPDHMSAWCGRALQTTNVSQRANASRRARLRQNCNKTMPNSVSGSARWGHPRLCQTFWKRTHLKLASQMCLASNCGPEGESSTAPVVETPILTRQVNSEVRMLNASGSNAEKAHANVVRATTADHTRACCRDVSSQRVTCQMPLPPHSNENHRFSTRGKHRRVRCWLPQASALESEWMALVLHGSPMAKRTAEAPSTFTPRHPI